MPKVPQVFSSGDTGFTAGARLNPEGFANLATSGIRTAAGEINQAAKQYQQIHATLRSEAEKLDAERALGEAQRQFVDADIDLKRDPTITPEQYPQEVERRLRGIREGVGKSLQYPGARLMFERGMGHFFDAKVRAAKYEGLERMDAQVKASTDLVLRQDEREAVFGPSPEVRETAVQRGLARITNLAGRRILSGTEANARTTAFLSGVEEGGIRLDARNADLREGVIDQLLNGKYTMLAPDRQLALADDLLREGERQQKLADEKAAKAAEVANKKLLDALEAKGDAGELTAAEVREAVEARVATGEDARRLRSYVRQGNAAGGRTDDDVYNRLELDLLENPRAHGAKEIRRIQSEGKLAASGQRSAATLLKLIGDEATAADAKDISQKPLFKQGLAELRQSLRGGAGPLESLDRPAATRLENAEREYHDLARSGKIPEQNLPETARRIVERLRRQVPLDLGDPDQSMLLRYQTPQDLLAAKTAGLIPDAEFNRQMDLMKRLGKLNAPAKPATGAAPPTKPGEKLRGGR